MTKNLSKSAKIMTGIIAAAAVGAIIVLAVLMLTGCKKTNPENNGNMTSDSSTDPGDHQIGDSGLDNTDLSALITALPDKEALAEMHSVFSGYWTSGDLFVGFVYTDDEPAIEYSLFQSSYGARGIITDTRAVSAHEAELTIYISAVPATEMDDAKPERTEIVSIDISNYNDNRLNIKIANLGDGEWHTYEYGGGSLEDASNNR